MCFDRLNKHYEPKATNTRLRPTSSTTPKNTSKYMVNTTMPGPGDVTEIEKVALNLWRTILFENFQERLLNAAMAKITEDRDSSFQKNETSRLEAELRPQQETQEALNIDAASSSAIGLVARRANDTRHGEHMWVPMGGDTIVGKLVDSLLRLSDVFPMAQRMKYYEESFEKMYVNRSREYYDLESSNYITNQGITNFVNLALLRLKQEEQRSKRYLHSSSRDKINKALEKTLIINHKEAMLAEFEKMLNQERKSHMLALHSLLNRLENGCDEMRTALSDYIIRVSTQALRNLVETSVNDVEARAASTAAAKRKKSDRGNAQNVSPAAYVDTMTQLHERFTSLVADSFHDDSSFVTTMDRAYKEAVNSTVMCDDPTLAPELLARQSDVLLRKGAMPLSEADLDLRLTQLVSVFKYIDDKDIFQNFYAKLLAKRLINAASVSDDSERATISLLKPLCSSEYMSRLQRMFTDMQLSKEVTEKFATYVQGLSSEKTLDSTTIGDSAPTEGAGTIAPTLVGNESVALNAAAVPKQPGEGDPENGVSASALPVQQRPQRPSTNIDFSIFVLTTGSWPLLEQQSSFNMPAQIVEYLNCFSAFYNELHTGRKLNWLYVMHRGEVRMLFPRKKYDVSATALQIGALLAFEDQAQLSVDQLTVILGLKPAEALSLVKNLLECKLVSKFSPSEIEAEATAKETNEDDAKPKKIAVASLSGGTVLQLNVNFANKKVKFKLPVPAPVEGAKGGAQAVEGEIEGDRAQFLQAVIVRTMKARKLLTHTQLIQEVLDQCKSRFRANVTLIKRQIDMLIEMEYLMRSKEKADVYQYCA